jgi:hypothetical protein
MNDHLKKALTTQFNDFVVAAVIVVKEAAFALIVLFVGHGLVWVIEHTSNTADAMPHYLRLVSDFGSGILFVVLVIKDLWEYFKQR